MANGAQAARFSRQDQDLLKDYGLNFNFDPFAAQSSSQSNVQRQWTKFDWESYAQMTETFLVSTEKTSLLRWAFFFFKPQV